jgi:hypothetical protein
MKKVIAGFCIVAGFTLPALSQDGNVKKETYPVHIISKEVQRLQFRDTEYTPAQVTTGDVAFVSSKGVNQLNAKRSVKTYAAVKRDGMPSWVISKGVARMQYEKGK